MLLSAVRYVLVLHLLLLLTSFLACHNPCPLELPLVRILASQLPLLQQQAASWQVQAAAPDLLPETPAGLLAPAHWLIVV
jgi:hypothetical protein